MTPEQVLKNALETVDGQAGKAFPLEGLKNAAAPFSFYLRQNWDEDDALDGPTGLQSATFEINFVARSYAELTALSGAAQSVLQALQGTTHEGLYIERVKLRQASPDLKEKEVNLYRRMYVLQMNYQEEEPET